MFSLLMSLNVLCLNNDFIFVTVSFCFFIHVVINITTAKVTHKIIPAKSQDAHCTNTPVKCMKFICSIVKLQEGILFYVNLK